VKLNDYKAGNRFVTTGRQVTAEEMMAFARRYDPQPIHTDRDYARTRGYPDITASVIFLLSAGWGLWISANIFSEANASGIAMDDIRCEVPVYPDDTLHVEVTMLEMRPSHSKPELDVLTLHFQMKNQREQVVLTYKDVSFVVREHLS
jgi:acyl dehydratase